MDAKPARQPLTPDQRNAFLAALLGWTMDAFDYFLVVLVYAEIAADFHTSLTRMAFLTPVTLMMRPVGALLFGLWADRAGRRLPLMVDVSFYSLIGFVCAFAPNYTVLLVLRLLYATVIPVLVLLAVVTAAGRESRGIRFGTSAVAAPAAT